MHEYEFFKTVETILKMQENVPFCLCIQPENF